MDGRACTSSFSEEKSYIQTGLEMSLGFVFPTL
jgi:hypothetical protein